MEKRGFEPTAVQTSEASETADAGVDLVIDGGYCAW